MKPLRVVAIIQARMGSTRLPGKVMADIVGFPMLWHVVNRVRRAQLVDEVVIATTNHANDSQIVDFCGANGIEHFCGSETDVLDRYYGAAQVVGAEGIVRITADCPLIDPAVIDRIVGVFRSGEYDYVTNVMRYTYPHGLDTEVFTFAALAKAWNDAKQSSQREHVTSYIRTSGLFRTANVESDVDYAPLGYRWTVDEPSDLAFVRTCYAKLWPAKPEFAMTDVIELLSQEPSLADINRTIVSHEGYYKSLVQDEPVPPAVLCLEKSSELAVRYKDRIPNVPSISLAKASGSRTWDLDGNEYVDYTGSVSSSLLGAGVTGVEESIECTLRGGLTGSANTRLAGEAAELLGGLIPNAEFIRFESSGSEALQAAIRLAIEVTGKRKILYPTTQMELSELDKDVAALVVDVARWSKVDRTILDSARSLIHQAGGLFIIDERKSGFRVAPGGVQQWAGVDADLAVFGETVANGLSLGAITGPREILSLTESEGVSGISLAVAIYTLNQIIARGSTTLWQVGQRLQDGFNVLARYLGVSDRAVCEGLAPCSHIHFHNHPHWSDAEMERLFAKECQNRGVRFSGRQDVTYSYGPVEVERTLRVYRSVLSLFGTIDTSAPGEDEEC